MINKHVDISDRILRAMPLLGIPFFIYQARKNLDMAKKDDERFIQGMRILNKEPEEKLLSHSLKQEWFLINSIGITLGLTWAVSAAILKHLFTIEFLFFTITILAIAADFLIGRIAIKVFTLKEDRNVKDSA